MACLMTSRPNPLLTTGGGVALKFWTGTKAQYDAIATKDSSTQYTCSDTGEMYLGEVALGKATSFRNIGEIVASTIPLTDAGLHLLDGALIDGNGSYAGFVTYIAGLVTDYPNLFVTESDWQTAVTTYGFCDKYVYDSTNNTVRLPKIGNQLVHNLPSTLGVKGNGMTLGLTNGTKNYGLRAEGGSGLYLTAYESSYGSNSFPGSYSGSSASQTNLAITIDSTKSGIIAETDNINTADVYYYVVIATVTKTAIQVDIDEIVTDLNGKADIDLTNASPTSAFGTALNTVGIRTVVETYSNGTSWYRVYSDGWCEQGGYFPKVSSYEMQTVTFLKPYRDTNYNVLTTVGGYDSSSTVQFVHIGAFNKTASSFQTRNDDSFDKTWQACGYIN